LEKWLDIRGTHRELFWFYKTLQLFHSAKVDTVVGNLHNFLNVAKVLLKFLSCLLVPNDVTSTFGNSVVEFVSLSSAESEAFCFFRDKVTEQLYLFSFLRNMRFSTVLDFTRN